MIDTKTMNRIADETMFSIVPQFDDMAGTIAERLQMVICTVREREEICTLVVQRLMHTIYLMSDGMEAKKAIEIGNKRANMEVQG